MAAALWGASLVWMTGHPPMVDLPQHAGQVALLRDLLFGDSPWADIVRINWLTPYLLGYGLALPLSLIMPAGTALKLLLTVAYLGFVALGIKLARHFDSDPRLDALLLVSFFGLAWSWGFVTFLITAPLVLAFVLMGSRYARNPSPPAALLIFGLGMLMLASHGLAFLFGWGVGALMLALELGRRPRVLLPAFIPYAALVVACAGYFLFSRALEAQFPAPDLQLPSRAYSWTRIVKVPLSTIGAFREDVFLLPVALVLVAVPFLMGLRMRRNNWRAMVPLAVVSIFMLTIPAGAFDTYFLYERFGVFLLPAWAWAFPAERGVRHVGWPRTRNAVGSSLLIVCCGFVLLHDSIRILHFGRDTEAVDAALRQLQPGARMLAMPFDAAALLREQPGARVWRPGLGIVSPEAVNRYAHVHYAAWYQADSHGFADLNFAWFAPQIVRFRADRIPRIAPGFEWKPESFNWHRHEGWRYRYFLVSGPMPPGVFQDAPCAPVTLFSDSTFTILESRSLSPDTAVVPSGISCGSDVQPPRPGTRR
jgi:hypothetical protein